jgi:hypothetical protein
MSYNIFGLYENFAATKTNNVTNMSTLPETNMELNEEQELSKDNCLVRSCECDDIFNYNGEGTPLDLTQNFIYVRYGNPKCNPDYIEDDIKNEYYKLFTIHKNDMNVDYDTFNEPIHNKTFNVNLINNRKLDDIINYITLYHSWLNENGKITQIIYPEALNIKKTLDSLIENQEETIENFTNNKSKMNYNILLYILLTIAIIYLIMKYLNKN